MKRKGLLKVVAVTGLLTLAASLFVACDIYEDSEERQKSLMANEGSRIFYSTYPHEYDYVCYDSPIVVNEGGKYILHTGNVKIPYCHHAAENGTSATIGGQVTYTPEVVLKCGDVLRTTQFVAYQKSVPASRCYDEVCDCAKHLVETEAFEEIDEANLEEVVL